MLSTPTVLNRVHVKVLMTCCKKTAHMISEHTIKVLQCINDAHSETLLIDVCAQLSNSVQHLRMAERIFYSLPTNEQTSVAANAMLKCYVEHDRSKDAISLFHTLKSRDDVSTTLFLKACVRDNDYDSATVIVDTYTTSVANIATSNIELITSIIQWYGHYGRVSDAQALFDCIPMHKMDVVCIAAMMQCLVDNQHYSDALVLYSTHKSDVGHNAVCNTLFLKACIHSNSNGNGHHHHHQEEEAMALVQQYLHLIGTQSSEFITSVIHFCGHIGRIEDAIYAFKATPHHKKDIPLITAMMKCYVDHARYADAICLFQHADDIQHDDVSKTLFLKACTNGDYYSEGKALINAHLHDMDRRSAEFVTTVVDFYGHFGHIDEAIALFDLTPAHKRNAALFACTMKALHSNGRSEEALRLFDHELRHPHQRDAFCYSIALNICASLICTDKGEQLIAELYRPPHAHILRDATVQAALIRFYAKTRQTQKAIDMFESMDRAVLDADPTAVIYCAIMDCFAKIGDTHKLLSLYDSIRMSQRRWSSAVSDIMASIVISGCAACGLLQPATRVFDDVARMIEIPSQSVIAMVDCFGRTQQLSQAEHTYKCYRDRLNLREKCVALTSMLSACRKPNDLCRAQRIFTEIQSTLLPRLHGQDITAACILMCNMYAQNNDFEKVNELRTKIVADASNIDNKS